ncbi:Dyp-type peroxidase [Microbispora sp. NPDC046933]|uniref:Dyp-type peroxidase n=1 Tax=Microbispora sp. NPDC046933 TaxID=3155618 RepID=UPI0033D9A123
MPEIFNGPLSRRKALTTAGTVVGGALLMSGSGGYSPQVPQPIMLMSPPPTYAEFTAIDIGEATSFFRELRASMLMLPASVEITIGLGASLFDKGVPFQRPRQLRQMPSFPGDLLDPDFTHADVLIQICAATTEEAQSATQDLLSRIPHHQIRWSVHGFRRDNREENGRALTRNLFGFTEGYGNPDRQDSQRALREMIQVPDTAQEPVWARAGTYQVVRLIRLAHALWDADPVNVQEKVIGRRRDGTRLDGAAPFANTPFTGDDDGSITPLDSHVRRANPRLPGIEPPRMLRRSFSYSRGRDGFGNLDEGLLFVCYQADLARGFEAVQQRLAGEALGRYTLTTGGGYFFVPAQLNPDRWWDG